MESESADVVQSLDPGDEPASSSVSADTENGNLSQNTEISCKDTSQKSVQVQQLCRFYSQGKQCYYGKRCRFLHQRPASAQKDEENGTTLKGKEGNLDGHPSDPQQQTRENGQSGTEELPPPPSHRTAPVKQQRARRPCRYFLSGFCAMEDRCRFFHPQQFPPVEDQPHGPKERSSFRPSAPTTRPAKSQEQVKLADLTDEVCKQLRATEIAQLTKRFPKDKLIVQEREDGQLTYYRLTVQATDPDWPFDLNEVDIMVSFPERYPQEVFTVDIPGDQNLPSVMGRYVQSSSEEWLKAKHATNQLMGRVELLFRPYLRWLDRSMEKLFTEGARQMKKDVDLEKAGIQFVPYEQIKVTVFKNTSKKSDTPQRIVSLTVASGEEGEEKELGEAGVENAEEEDETAFGSDGEEGSQKVENIKTRERRRGTEIKLLGLKLGEQIATVAAKEISVSLKCNRCKVDSDLTLTGRLPCTAQCEKCQAGIRAAFRPSMLHHYSDVLGYLDLNAVAPVDLILKDSVFSVGCLNCNKEDTVQNLTYGQNWEQNCQHCHTKLSIFVEATRFQFIQPQPRNQTGAAAQYSQRYRDPAVQQGKPLPDKGACRHFKQSQRWLRFPCCGRAYPCDMCHDEDQDHPMELATRMICGYCAKEQPYSNGKPCINCGSMMTRAAFTSHWEGGQGCRNKVKMSRNDRQKYANTCKTVPKKNNKEKSN
uniref:Nucleoporin NUP42 n=1 Tax=Cyprinus carpio TaxID=7962 RepID=A0A8C2DU81_CYPCA